MRRLAAVLLLLSAFAYSLERQPNTDYRARRYKLAQAMEGGVLVLFASTEDEGQDSLYGYFPEKDFYYLTGWAEPGAALVISPDVPAKGGKPAREYTEILFLPAHNVTQERWTGPKLGADSPNIRQQTGFQRVEVLDKLRDILVTVLPQPAATIYTDVPTGNARSSSTTGIEWLSRANAFPNYLSVQDSKPVIAELRKIKDAGEMKLIRHATEASMAAHLAAFKGIRPGITEREISSLMQFEFGKRGCERPAYSPIVGSGKNGTVLHYAENSGTMNDGEVVVMDVGGEYAMYASDITRTVPVNGKFTPRQRELYDIVLGAQRAAIAAFESGKSTVTRSGQNTIYKAAFDYINTHGKDLHGQPLGQYFIHGLSHFVGMDVHDVGEMGPVQPGTVFTIEPGIYIPEEGIGIRIEDIFWVAPDGKLVNLSESLPRTADEIEALMRK